MSDIGELKDFIVDSEDGKYDDTLHQAAWRGDYNELEDMLSKNNIYLDFPLRPFGATPLRLAAMNYKAQCVELLLKHGAAVDIPDRKGQTPLFCAVKNCDTDCCVLLLRSGACPDGDRRNLSTPLYLACQNRYPIGVKLLLDYGAQIEWPHVPPAWLHPLHVAATYGHLDCFILLLLGGADIRRAGNVLHIICSRKCDSSFVNIWAQFGGRLWDRNNKGQLASELSENPHIKTLIQVMEHPLSLQSLCRLTIRKVVGRHRLHLLHTLQVAHVLADFLLYKEIPEVKMCLLRIESELSKCSYI